VIDRCADIPKQTGAVSRVIFKPASARRNSSGKI